MTWPGENTNIPQPGLRSQGIIRYIEVLVLSNFHAANIFLFILFQEAKDVFLLHMQIETIKKWILLKVSKITEE